MAGTNIGWRSRGRHAHFVLLVLLATAAITGAAVAGCGTLPAPGAAGGSSSGTASGSGTSAGGSAAKPDPALCSDAGAVTSVAVTRHPSLPGAPAVRRVPKMVITDKARVRTLAGAICVLPVLPKGILHCPLNAAGTYRFIFSSAGQKFTPVTIEASGCQLVTGTGKVRWVARTPKFWPVLSRIIGIEVPMHPLLPQSVS